MDPRRLLAVDDRHGQPDPDGDRPDDIPATLDEPMLATVRVERDATFGAPLRVDRAAVARPTGRVRIRLDRVGRKFEVGVSDAERAEPGDLRVAVGEHDGDDRHLAAGTLDRGRQFQVCADRHRSGELHRQAGGLPVRFVVGLLDRSRQQGAHGSAVAVPRVPWPAAELGGRPQVRADRFEQGGRSHRQMVAHRLKGNPPETRQKTGGGNETRDEMDTLVRSLLRRPVLVTHVDLAR